MGSEQGLDTTQRVKSRNVPLAVDTDADGDGSSRPSPSLSQIASPRSNAGGRTPRNGEEGATARVGPDVPGLEGATLEEKFDSGVAQVVVCGQRVSSTVRGKPVQEAREEVPNGIGTRKNDDVKYVAAKDKRVKLERSLLIEEYQEQKLIERIKNLEYMKTVEIDHLEVVERREAGRKAREEEIKKKLLEDVDRKSEEERMQAEQEKERKEQEAEEKRKWKEHAQKQKEVMEKWYAEQNSQESAFGVERVRQRRDEQWAQQLERLKEKETSRMRTVQRIGADEKALRTAEAIEHRPPLAPKPHDRPGPVLDFSSGGCSGSRSGSKSARGGRRPETWANQAKVVSNMYGLSGKDAAHVEEQLVRVVKGSGRMAGYTPREDPKAPTREKFTKEREAASLKDVARHKDAVSHKEVPKQKAAQEQTQTQTWVVE